MQKIGWKFQRFSSTNTSKWHKDSRTNKRLKLKRKSWRILRKKFQPNPSKISKLIIWTTKRKREKRNSISSRKRVRGKKRRNHRSWMRLSKREKRSNSQKKCPFFNRARSSSSHIFLQIFKMQELAWKVPSWKPLHKMVSSRSQLPIKLVSSPIISSIALCKSLPPKCSPIKLTILTTQITPWRSRPINTSLLPIQSTWRKFQSTMCPLTLTSQ